MNCDFAIIADLDRLPPETASNFLLKVADGSLEIAIAGSGVKLTNAPV